MKLFSRLAQEGGTWKPGLGAIQKDSGDGEFVTNRDWWFPAMIEPFPLRDPA